MPACKPEEFFVDKVIKARVAPGARGKKYWEFETLWKGYLATEATWIPQKNFQGDKWALKVFWERSDVGNRDPSKLNQFEVGEIFQLREEVAVGFNCPAANKSSKPRIQKPGPGRSSAALVSKVFALWPDDNLYYPGIVQRRLGDKYVVRFMEDDSELVVNLEHMHLCAKLRPSDRIVVTDDMNTVSMIGEDGTIVLKKRVKVEDVKLSTAEVDKYWQDRLLSHHDIICAQS
ncbi:hypothetical protein FB45DRAFT_889134 [Roridomyces roridus]|uniref:Chromo domain-containing protein n=1 Tax=Roridomyces roridus TaxID=1738132 RepID=A0AAD7G1P5_9AGAR|nr:hypothetical protein FB45DRAFT_889134 [Roridomyces roridus]